MEDKFKCEDCSVNFATKSGLIHHRKTAAYCLELRGVKLDIGSLICKYCSKNFTRNDTLQKHYETCKCKVVVENNKTIQEFENKISILELQIKTLTKENNKKDAKIKKLTNNTQITVNNNVQNKLTKVCTSTIKPLTIKTVKEFLRDDKYSVRRVSDLMNGWISFLIELMTIKDSDGNIIERNYVCTNKKQNNFYRYTGKDEEKNPVWVYDSGGLWLHNIINHAGERAEICAITARNVLTPKEKNKNSESSEWSSDEEYSFSTNENDIAITPVPKRIIIEEEYLDSSSTDSKENIKEKVEEHKYIHPIDDNEVILYSFSVEDYIFINKLTHKHIDGWFSLYMSMNSPDESQTKETFFNKTLSKIKKFSAI